MRRLTLLFSFAAILVGCTSIENRSLYHPRPYDGDIALESPQVEDVELDTQAGKIHARFVPQPGATGAILFCHGNAGNLQWRQKQLTDLRVALGESTLIFDYPGYGKSTGTVGEQGCYDAAAAAYQWLTTVKKIPPERILIYGESLGGAVAVDLATKQRHGALILDRTFTSAPDVADYQMPLFPGYWVMTNRFDSLSKISQCRQPIFIAAADKDALIPLRQSEQLKRACTGPSTLFLMKGIGHNDPLPTDFYPALRTFLAQNAVLGTKK
jgi:fermentation-respiration switch protein FrsA (DUF1100 family)